MFISLQKSYFESRPLERQHWRKADLCEATRSMGFWVPRRGCRQQSSLLHPSKDLCWKVGLLYVQELQTLALICSLQRVKKQLLLLIYYSVYSKYWGFIFETWFHIHQHSLKCTVWPRMTLNSQSLNGGITGMSHRAHFYEVLGIELGALCT